MFQVTQHGTSGILEFLVGFLGIIALLFVFFLLKMFGAGDIKTFAVIGGLYGISYSVTCIVYSIFVGGVIALLSMIRSKTAFHRFYSLYQYVSGCVNTKRIESYPIVEAKESGGTIHFTLPILLGFVITRLTGTLF